MATGAADFSRLYSASQIAPGTIAASHLSDDAIKFTEASESSAYSSEAWAEWDLSEIIPEGTRLVFVLVRYTASNSSNVPGVRRVGSTLDRRASMRHNQGGSQATLWPVTANAERKIERYGGPQVSFMVVGWI